MSIGFWQVVIVLGVIVYIIVRKIKNKHDPLNALRQNVDTIQRRELKREHEHAVLKHQQRKARSDLIVPIPDSGVPAAKEEKVSANEPSGGGLTANIARLKKLYKNGTLTKAEFEKAKNNLLK